MPVLPMQAKPASYYGHPRLNLLDALPRPYGRVLDIGCGGGAAGEELLRRGATELVGVELDPGAAELARERGYGQVLVGDAERVAANIDESFDTILCHDILEHLLRPDTLLREIARFAQSGATLSVSAPNARHVSLLYDLIAKGTFGYQLEGHRDATHVRWFTRKDLIQLIEESGWQVTRVWWGSSRRYTPLLALGRPGREFGASSWYVQAQI